MNLFQLQLCLLKSLWVLGIHLTCTSAHGREILIKNTQGKQIVNVHACAAAEKLQLSVHRGLLFVSPDTSAGELALSELHN